MFSGEIRPSEIGVHRYRRLSENKGELARGPDDGHRLLAQGEVACASDASAPILLVNQSPAPPAVGPSKGTARRLGKPCLYRCDRANMPDSQRGTWRYCGSWGSTGDPPPFAATATSSSWIG